MVEGTGKLEAGKKRLVNKVTEITAAFITTRFVLKYIMTSRVVNAI
jgi:hypothetical protein